MPAVHTTTPPAPFPDPIAGILPFGTITIFAGAPGVGKTAMLADWIVRMRDGREIWGHPTSPPTAFAYIAADRQWASHQQWFDAVGCSDIPRYSLADDTSFNLSDLLHPYKADALFLRCLERCCNGQPPPPGAHVFVDPVSPLFIMGSPNSSRDVARTLMSMSRECQRRKINITCVAHFSKQPTDRNARYQRPQDRIAGSGAFSGFSDTQVYLLDPEPPDQPYHLLGWNPRHRRPEEFKCQRDPRTGLFLPFDVIVDDTSAFAVLELFPEDGSDLRFNAILDRALAAKRLSPATTKRALRRLLELGAIEQPARGRYVRRGAVH